MIKLSFNPKTAGNKCQSEESCATHLTDFRPDGELSDDKIHRLLYAQALLENAQRAQQLSGLSYARETAKSANQVVADACGIDSPEYGFCLGLLGSIDLDLFRLNDAIDELKQAKSIMQKHQASYNPHDYLAVECKLASAYDLRGDHNTAILLFKECLQECHVRKHTGDAGYTTVLLCTAGACLNVDNVDEGYAYLHDAQQDWNKNIKGNDFLLSVLNSHMGTYYSLKGNYVEADKHFKKAFEILRKSDRVPPTIYALMAQSYSDALVAQNKYEEAISVLSDCESETENRLGRQHPLTLEIQQKTDNLIALRDKTKEGIKGVRNL